MKRRLNETELFAMLMGCTEHPPKRLPDGYIAFARAIESYYGITDGSTEPKTTPDLMGLAEEAGGARIADNIVQMLPDDLARFLQCATQGATP